MYYFQDNFTGNLYFCGKVQVFFMAKKKAEETINKAEEKDNRKRVFAFLVYPTERYIKENYPDCQYDGADGWGITDDEEWMGKLKGTMWKGFISPLHYQDKDGDHYKKPHWHVLIIFGQNAKKDWDNQIKPIITEILTEKGFSQQINVVSAQGYARYLCHLDNPEKAQYDKEKVVCFGGANYLTTINCAEDNVRIQKEILNFIKQNDVLFFNNLVDWCMDNNEEWYQFLSKNCYFIREYLKAKNAEMNAKLQEQSHVISHEEYQAFLEYMRKGEV